MALRRYMANRLFKTYRAATPDACLENSHILKHPHSPPSTTGSNLQRKWVTSLESDKKGFVCRFMHFGMLEGENLRQKLLDFSNIAKGDEVKQNNLQLDGLTSVVQGRPSETISITIEDRKKLLNLVRIKKLRAKLKEISEKQISLSEFVQICVEESQDEKQGLEFSRILNDCGSVIILGNTVFLYPDQITKSIENLISHFIMVPNDPRRKEFEELKMVKSFIDNKAKAWVRGELYLGLGYLFLQTLWFMKLTFWVLSWDVMEPICFFVHSIQFALAYGFFLRTSTEPSFEGYFNTRFKTKQKKLMKTHNFDADKYNELCNLFGFPNLDNSTVIAPVLITKMDP